MIGKKLGPKRPKSRKKMPWSQKHVERVDFYPAMENLVEWMKPYGDMTGSNAFVIAEKHGLMSPIAPLIALREVINERIAMEVAKILEMQPNDDVADAKIMVWHMTTRAREKLVEENEELIPHLADGLHPQNAAVFDGVQLSQLQ